MSSTNRGAQRQEFDYYITPQGPIRTFLQHFKGQFPNFTPQRILDPCAGGNTVEVKWQYKKDMHAVWAKGEFYREETILRII